ncbi:hypothetical protein L596_024738 [Steinernema carpocapsae]|uniref:Uncharacterized protein n=1 Tax=Steinernema carpocapsae TaxID=34508 RepID=A0A4U5M5M4_STECR|nr:hypothetical protein L596_024738 [Steinernema carpocapsae]
MSNQLFLLLVIGFQSRHPIEFLRWSRQMNSHSKVSSCLIVDSDSVRRHRLARETSKTDKGQSRQACGVWLLILTEVLRLTLMKTVKFLALPVAVVWSTPLAAKFRNRSSDFSKLIE